MTTGSVREVRVNEIAEGGQLACRPADAPSML